jgi:hypothetical protein
MAEAPSKMQEQNPYRKLTLHDPEGTQQVGRPAIRQLNLDEENLKTVALEIVYKSHRSGPIVNKCKRGQGSL